MGASGGDGVCREDRVPRHRGGLMGESIRATDSQWPLWEVFTQSEQGAPHEHAGSLHAVDAEQALQSARDVYARRGGVISLWVVPAAAITASSPGENGPFFDPGADKAYRHPQFYKVPRGVRGL
jgi:ring-1,2-phenylacetyl-CoA epoxidase subunit PaaB